MVEDLRTDGRRLTVRLRSPDGAPVLHVEAISTVQITAVELGGERFEAAGEEAVRPVRLELAGFAAAGVEVTFELPDRWPVELHLTEQFYGLPEEPAPPPELVPSTAWTSHSRLVHRSFLRWCGRSCVGNTWRTSCRSLLASSPSDARSDILGVVLAGGASRRMGRDKAVLPWTGTTLVHRAAAVLAEVCGEVVIAGPAALAPTGAEAVADVFPGRGPLAGLHAGLERAAGRAIFALACDLPFVGVELVAHLVAAADAAGRGAGAWVAAGADRLQPLCGVYAAAGRAVAERRLRAGRLSVLGFVEAIGGVAVPITAELAFYRPELLLNLNRPADSAAGAPAARGPGRASR